MTVFRFKQFAVKQTDSAMKVGTDSVLLGSLLKALYPKRILDIGTGTGLLALMMAQRFGDAVVDAVEIEEKAFAEATKNAAQSVFAARINVVHQSLQAYAETSSVRYDLIVSNPPYYEVGDQYSIAVQNRSQARHTTTLSFDELLNNVWQLLAEQGRCWMVLPAIESELVIDKAERMGLYCIHRIAIYPKHARPFNRLVFCFATSKETAQEEHFFIKDKHGVYTHQYREATMPFLLWNK